MKLRWSQDRIVVKQIASVVFVWHVALDKLFIFQGFDFLICKTGLVNGTHLRRISFYWDQINFIYYKHSKTFSYNYLGMTYCGRRRGWDVSREQHRNMYII